MDNIRRICADILLRRAKRASSSRPQGNPPIEAALCLRLLHHARETGRIRASGQSELLAWASDSYTEWTGRLLSGTSADLSSLSTDQVNLLLGILCLPDAGDRRCAGDAYAAFFSRVCRRGVLPIVSHSVELFRELVDGLSTPWAGKLAEELSRQSGEPKPHPITASVGMLATHALAATAFGCRNYHNDDSKRLSPILQAFAFKAIRNGDVSEAGLVLVCTMLLLGRPALSSLPAWLESVLRTDGLAGIWDLATLKDGETASLLGTVNVYMGLHAFHRPGTALYPSLDNTAPLKDRPLRSIPVLIRSAGQNHGDALLHLCQWVDKNRGSFQLADLEPGFRIRPALKALAELATVVWTLTLPHHAARQDRYYLWARETAEALREVLCEERIIEAFRSAPALAPLLRSYPLIAAATGRELPFLEEARILIAHPHALAVERPPMERLEYKFLVRAAQANVTMEGQSRIFERTVLAQLQGEPLFCDSNDWYDVAHIICYLTDYGQHKAPELDAIHEWLGEYLPAITLSCMQEGDFDLGAEMLLAELHCGLDSELSAQSASLLCEAVASDGSVPLPPWSRKQQLPQHDFLDQYHTVLVVLLSLGEYCGRQPVANAH